MRILGSSSSRASARRETASTLDTRASRVAAVGGAILVVGACAPGLRSGDDRASVDPGIVDASVDARAPEASVPPSRDGGLPPAFDASDDASDASIPLDASDAQSSDAGGDAASDTGDASPTTLGCARHRRYVAGDIDGDGRGDIALTGGWIPDNGGPWNTVPVAFSRGDGTFDVTNNYVPDFPIYTTQGPVAIGGDANGDGKLDILAEGGRSPNGVSWATLPVAASTGRNGFLVTNSPLADFAALAQQPGPTVLPGDFDGDGFSDVALVGSASWTVLPIAQSLGDGTFSVVRRTARDFNGSIVSGTRAVSGDFDADGKWELALLGVAAPDTVVVGYSNGDGTFRTVSVRAPSLSSHLRADALLVSGDFDGDGRDDVAFAGSPGASDVVLVLARASSFAVVSAPGAGFAALAAKAPQLVSFDADGDGCSDLALVGGIDAASAQPWTTIPVAFSNGDGTFHFTTETVPDFPLYATQQAMAVSASAARR
jgi:hypothetical protein